MRNGQFSPTHGQHQNFLFWLLLGSGYTSLSVASSRQWCKCMYDVCGGFLQGHTSVIFFLNLGGAIGVWGDGAKSLD